MFYSSHFNFDQDRKNTAPTHILFVEIPLALSSLTYLTEEGSWKTELLCLFPVRFCSNTVLPPSLHTGTFRDIILLSFVQKY